MVWRAGHIDLLVDMYAEGCAERVLRPGACPIQRGSARCVSFRSAALTAHHGGCHGSITRLPPAPPPPGPPAAGGGPLHRAPPSPGPGPGTLTGGRAP